MNFKLTKKAKQLLEWLNEKYKWIARDGEPECELSVYTNKPYESDVFDEVWDYDDGDYAPLTAFQNWFPFITWESGAMYIPDLLRVCEIIEE